MERRYPEETVRPNGLVVSLPSDRYSSEELLLFRGYLEWRRIYASMPHTGSLQKVKWPPWMDDTLHKLREDTAHLANDWDRQPEK
jgi:hypothetical protein